MGNDGADSVDAIFTLLVPELLAVASIDVVAVLVDIAFVPGDISALDGVVEKAMKLLDIVSNVVRIVLVGNPDGKKNDSVAAVTVTNGKDIVGMLVVVASSKELETEDSVVVGEDSIVNRVKEEVEEGDSRIDHESEVVPVDRSLVADTVDDVVAKSSGSETVAAVVENASVKLSVEVSDVEGSSVSDTVAVVAEDASGDVAVVDVASE
ncbi:hypothetical protein CGCF415_v005505 [Colletotrichum fructicola]|uniref:Uncharacterized protein n=1 Tax=Colletotrichum fructicola (strain Nara gc5) TaxID=1213859 RepID=L2GFX5_COLFN|nr:uncharacterized protein CGMCC3_g12599 [Colletotrichum fructicola]KAF4476682.1 hypothetical protein CGGC5_v015307 [Colletotrichum fructicola Nara gc5]KAE9571371.1 hypothetical protein CGMCC3_g12599 [Colletotrichum fructicola]KAF4427041.1 hypothetical protein CFRS1_v003300 [Colletotrichum fructicola]KAF4900477.1 hypothetical protein CGCFRS4_v003232 [Colletotrichum fructicola]KAF4910172.1 hypothetical protein CGCF415_v005505 [Colletotrichum fructicola]